MRVLAFLAAIAVFLEFNKLLYILQAGMVSHMRWQGPCDS